MEPATVNGRPVPVENFLPAGLTIFLSRSLENFHGVISSLKKKIYSRDTKININKNKI
jgi:hypothetical protein